MKGIFHEKNREAHKKTSIMQKRYLNFPLPPNTMIINDKIVIFSWKNEPSGVLIISQDMSKHYADFFDSLWKLARK